MDVELTSDSIAIQGILQCLVHDIGDITKINHRGGNEQKILTIMKAIQHFLCKKKYIEDNKVKSDHEKNVEDIVMFLALNTKYEKPIENNEYAHVVGITPPLSKCVLSNVLYGLDLVKYYCIIVEKLPLHCATELLKSAIFCIKKSNPEMQLHHSYMFLKASYNKLASLEYTSEADADINNFLEATNVILQNFTMLPVSDGDKWKTTQIYKHMGYCLLNLFNLLLFCKKESPAVEKFISYVIRACCSVVMNVTIDVYCLWAEIEDEDENLQSTIATKAYKIIQSFERFPVASELVSMLKAIARKPKTLTEEIREADVPRIIKKINEKNPQQKAWFQALLQNPQILDDKEALCCIEKWSHLCDEDEVVRFLNLFADSKREVLKKLIIDSTKHFSLDKLLSVMVKHFYRNKFEHVLCDDVEGPVTLLFNKISEDKCPVNDLEKEVNLLLLQNPKVILKFLYSKCIRSTFNSNILKGTFESNKEIARIDDIGVTMFNKVIEDNIPNEHNVQNYAELFKLLISLDYFSNEAVWQRILYPLLKILYDKEDLQGLNSTLQITLDSSIKIHRHLDNKEGIEFLLRLMTKYRCKFLTFNSLKQHIVKLIVDILLDLCIVYREDKLILQEEDSFSSYYRNNLTADADCSFFRTFCPSFDMNKQADCVARLLEFLPMAVTREWVSVAEEITRMGGAQKCIELLTDMLILLCELVETQNLESAESLFAALKYCIQNFGIVVQKIIQCNQPLATEVKINFHICRLLSHLPNSVKEEEGLSLVNVLSEKSLQSCKDNKEFLCCVLMIKNSRICKTIAQKMSV